MKKVLLIALGFFAFQANAQEEVSYKPTTGTVTTEVGLTGGLNNANFNLNGATGQVKFRYFLKDDIAIRAGLGINNSKKDSIFGPDSNQITRETKNSNLDFKVGIEKHFAGSNRLSTYAGADLVIGSGNVEVNFNEQNGDFDKFGQKNSSFGVAFFTGADYYIAQKVYLGVEAGLSFISSKLKDAETSFKDGNNTGSDSDPGTKETNFNSSVFGGIRIGFQF